MYKVYAVTASCYYDGLSLVAADSVEEANEFIERFKKNDKNNRCDSWGYDKVYEHDLIDGLYAEEKGFVYYGISYRG